MMIRNAPGLVKPLPTSIPIFKTFSGLFNAPLKFLGWLEILPGEFVQHARLELARGRMRFGLVQPGHDEFADDWVVDDVRVGLIYTVICSCCNDVVGNN